MTSAIRTTATTIASPQRIAMSSMRKTALAAGALYLLSFVSIPTLFLYSSVHKTNYIIGSGTDTAVVVGVMLELIVALAGIGTAVVLFPVLKRENEGVALGLVGSRTVEACTIFIGAASLMAIVALRRDGVGADALVTGKALIAVYDIFFRIGQSFLPAVNAVLLGTLLYRTRLVPRALPLLGLIAAPLLIAADVASLFGLFGQMGMFGLTSSVPGLAGMPIALWEFSLGVWLVVKGFNAEGIARISSRTAASTLAPDGSSAD
jgi:hypothetical protein